jgi:branched-chain amino acid transport system permease protein
VGWLGAGYPLIIPYVVMIIGLIVRPYGLFGTPEVRRV